MIAVFRIKNDSFFQEAYSSLEKLHAGYYAKYPRQLPDGKHAGFFELSDGFFGWTTCAGNQLVYDRSSKQVAYYGRRHALRDMMAVPKEEDCLSWAIHESQLSWLPPWYTTHNANEWLMASGAVLQPNGKWFLDGKYLSLES